MKLKKYKVTYQITHTRIFEAPHEKYIKCILNEHNNCVIYDIEEINDDI